MIILIDAIDEKYECLISKDTLTAIKAIDIMGFKVKEIDLDTSELIFKNDDGVNFYVKWMDLSYGDSNQNIGHVSLNTTNLQKFNMIKGKSLTLKLPYPTTKNTRGKPLMELRENGKIHTIGGKSKTKKSKIRQGPRGGKYYMKGGNKVYVK